MKKLIPALIATLALFFCTGSKIIAQETAAKEPTTLTLYVAASLTEVIQKIGKDFASAHNVKLVYNFGASGALAQQIIASPRADVFISADQRRMNEIDKAGQMLAGTRKTLLKNTLVVIGNPAGNFTLSDPAQLPSLTFKFLSIGDPAFVPAGTYTKKWLESVKTADGKTVWSQVEGRTSPATDVRAALSQVEGKSDIIGVVYRTDYMAFKNKLTLLYQVPPSEVVNISYPVAVLSGSKHQELAKAFVDFLFTAKSQQMLAEQGFLVDSAK